MVTESTYGDRNHEPPESYTEALAQLIDETLAQGGNVIIPSFAVGRTQELLYFLREIKDEGLVKSVPNFQVWWTPPWPARPPASSPAICAAIWTRRPLRSSRAGDDLFTFPGLTLAETTEESKALNMDRSSKVIISASGMCDAGRIRHHLKHNLWRPECAVVFVGYQAEGTLGRRLLEGAKSVKLFGEEIAVKPASSTSRGSPPTPTGTTCCAWIEHFAPTPQAGLCGPRGQRGDRPLCQGP